MNELVLHEPQVAVEDLSVERLRSELDQVRSSLSSLGPDQLLKAAVWAEAVAAAARVERLLTVAYEAEQTRLHAERRLGILVAQFDKTAIVGVGQKRLATFLALGQMPNHVFDNTVADLAATRGSLAASNVLRQSHYYGLETLPGERLVRRSWDGSLFIQANGGRWRRARSNEIEKAVAEAEAEIGMRRHKPRSPIQEQLDDAYARTRREAQSLGTLRESLSGRTARLVAKAEGLVGEAADLLLDAYKQKQAEDTKR